MAEPMSNILNSHAEARSNPLFFGKQGKGIIRQDIVTYPVLAKLDELMRSYFARGGFQMQINLVSRDDLLAARANPRDYADLVVRVGGFSDYFVRLAPALQDEIIARTEHEV